MTIDKSQMRLRMRSEGFVARSPAVEARGTQNSFVGVQGTFRLEARRVTQARVRHGAGPRESVDRMNDQPLRMRESILTVIKYCITCAHGMSPTPYSQTCA